MSFDHTTPPDPSALLEVCERRPAVLFAEHTLRLTGDMDLPVPRSGEDFRARIARMADEMRARFTRETAAHLGYRVELPESATLAMAREEDALSRARLGLP